ncbi:DEP domain-containing protein 4 isoform X2 [Hippocampus comes]|uniref:DEP domain-containing protein 4 isoform X2 n=1 Tax=Hippocampus comes TaxID=109280 RepID=UPI00094F258B|nr:PREDICTED: DEP domain-containing protein 4 isoform X2 [Hippocampus comes]
MAVDLTPRFRRLNSETRSFRDNLHHRAGPFSATQLWHNIIHALRTQVEVRHHRRHLHIHTNSFVGCDAVDAVLSYLMQNATVGAGGGEVSRLTATRLCQALMEAGVFEPVGAKLFGRDKEATFEDGGGSLYRFVERKGQDHDRDTEDEVEMKKHRLNDVDTISNPLTVGQPDRKVARLLSSINLQPSPPPATSSFLPHTVVEEVWKHQALLQLLQTVELPVLDSILASPARSQARAERAPLQDLVIPNTCLERELPDVLNFPQWDGWLSATAECLELLPDQLIVAAGEQLRQPDGAVPSERAKRLVFDAIAKHYDGREKAPLLSGRYLDVHVAILKLLEEGKVHLAIRAAQLCLHLLQTSVRDELRRLLAFMAAAACPHACRLQKQADNRALVCRTFLKAVVHHSQLTRAQSETLVLFLMDHHSDLFKTPMSLNEAVQKTLRNMQEGKDVGVITPFAFCEQVTPQEYRKRRDDATHEGLKGLLLHVASSSVSSRKKRRRLKQFEKHHPVVFLQHLCSTI